MANRRLGINIDIKFAKSSEVKAQLDSLLKSVGKNAKLELTLDTKGINKTFAEISKSLNTINKEIKSTFDMATYFAKQKKDVEEATNAQIKYQKAAGKSLNIGDGAKGFNDLKARADEIRRTVDSLAKINFNTTKNGALKDATITYTDGMGKVVSETMKWKNVATDTENVVKRVFTTTNVAVSENISTLDKLNNKLSKTKEQMQGRLNTSKNNSFVDTSVVDGLQARLNKINTDTPEKEIRQLNNEIKNLASGDSGIVRLQNQITKMQQSIGGLKNKYGSLVTNDSKKSLSDTEKQISNLQSLLSKLKGGQTFDSKYLSSEINKANGSMRQLTNDTKNASGALRLAQKDATTLGGAFKDIATKVGLFSLTYRAMGVLSQSFRDGIIAVKEMDSAITTLSITMNGLTSDSLQGMVTRSQELATSLSSTTSKVLEAVKTFANAGESLNSIFDKTSSAIILSNLTGLDTQATVNTIQSATKQFKDLSDGSAESAMKVTNSMVAISKAMGLDFSRGIKDMSESLSILGSLADQVGMDLDETLATIGSGMEKLRLTGSEVATSIDNLCS